MEPVTPSWLLLGARATYRVTISAALINGIRASSSNFALPPKKIAPLIYMKQNTEQQRPRSEVGGLPNEGSLGWHHHLLLFFFPLFFLFPLPLPPLSSLPPFLSPFIYPSVPTPHFPCAIQMWTMLHDLSSLTFFNKFSGFLTTPICLYFFHVHILYKKEANQTQRTSFLPLSSCSLLARCKSVFEPCHHVR